MDINGRRDAEEEESEREAREWKQERKRKKKLRGGREEFGEVEENVNLRKAA